MKYSYTLKELFETETFQMLNKRHSEDDERIIQELIKHAEKPKKSKKETEK